MPAPRIRGRSPLLVLVLALSLLAAACAAAADAPDERATVPSPTPSTTTGEGSDLADAFPVTLAGPGGEITLEAPPRRIVSLSPTATEILFAIGAGDLVVAADEYSDHPPEAPTTDLSGFDPNIEAISGYDPDLVVASDDLGGLVDGLAAIGVPTLLQPAPTTFDGAFDQVEQLGAATGRTAEAADLTASLRAEIDRIVTATPRPDEPLTVYHELDPTFYSVTSSTFIGQVYEVLGLVNIADAAEASGGPYPQLSTEFIVESDPDLILLADAACCDVTPDAVAARPGWDTIAAVRHDAVVVLDEDVASRWGPRVVDLVRTVAEEIEAIVGAEV